MNENPLEGWKFIHLATHEFFSDGKLWIVVGKGDEWQYETAYIEISLERLQVLVTDGFRVLMSRVKMYG